MSRFEDRLKLLAPAPVSDALRAKIAHPSVRSRSWKRIIPIAAAAAGLMAALMFTILKAPTGTPARRDDAEKEFRRIEQALRVGSLRVSYKRTSELILPKPMKVEDEGVLLLKEGNRLNLTLTETIGVGAPNPTTVTFVYLCDGSTGITRVKSPQGMTTAKNIAVPLKDLQKRILLSLARDSITLAPTLFTLDVETVERVLEAREFAFGTDEEGRRVLTYRVKEFDVKLWYDPQTLLPRKRVSTHPNVGTSTETYDGWDLHSELPQELFRLPEEK